MTDRERVSERLAELLAEWHEQRAAGADLDVDEFASAHPELADELRAKLAAMDFLDRAFEPELSQDLAPPGEAPRTIGPYRIVQEVGRGGMGVVYEAEQVSMERRVALKVLTPSLTSGGRSVHRFKTEARAAGRLHHTNIVPVYDMGQHAGHWYYAMELIEGWPLNRIVDELRAGGERAATCRLEVESSGVGRGDNSGSATDASWYRTVAAMFAGVADALAAAHDESIVHRDVKPGNLLLHTDGTLKLVDFGLAHLDDNGPKMTRTGDVLGTPAYMSPEQAESRRERVDYRTDIYSLGATLYEVVTLAAPFDGNSLAELCSKIASNDPIAPRNIDRGIPKDLETIVLKAMEKSPGQRYSSAADLARDLRAFCEGNAVRARRVGVLGRWSRRVKRHKVRSALAAAIVILAAGGSALAWQLAERDRDARYERLIARGRAATAASFGYARGAEDRPQPASGAMSWELFSAAIALAPGRADAYWLRALTPGSIDDRLRDVDAAWARGLGAGTAHWLRAYLFSQARRHEEAGREQGLAESYLDAETPETSFARALFVLRSRRTDDALAHLSAAIAGSEQLRIVRYLALRERAELNAQLERPEDALRDLLAIHDLGDDSVRVRIQIAALWKQLERTETAENIVAEVLDEVRASGDPSAWRQLMLACERVGEKGWLEQTSSACVTACQALLETQPASAELRHALGLALIYTEQYAAAIDVLERAVELEPDLARTWNSLGHAHWELERWDDAAAAFRTAIERQPRLPQAHSNLGNALISQGHLDEAIVAIRTAIELQPDNAGAYNSLGAALQKEGRLDEAIVAFRTAIERQPRLPQAHSNLGNALISQGHLDEAIVAIRTATELDPSYAGAFQNLGNLLKASGRLDEAIVADQRAIKLRPDEPTLHYNLGIHLRSSGRLDEAIAAYRTALRLRPDYPWARNNLGLALRDNGELDEAIASFRTATDLQPHFPRAYRNLGVALLAAGRAADAVAALREADRQEPDHAKALFNLGWALVECGQHDDAIAPLVRAAELRADVPPIQLQLGRALRASGRLDEALVAFSRAIDLPDSKQAPYAFWQIACVHAAGGRADKAFASLSRAVDAGWSGPDSLESESCWDSLRDDARYAELLDRIRD